MKSSCSLVLFIDTSEPTSNDSFERMEQDKIEREFSKIPTPPNNTDHTNATPPPQKKTI